MNDPEKYIYLAASVISLLGGIMMVYDGYISHRKMSVTYTFRQSFYDPGLWLTLALTTFLVFVSQSKNSFLYEHYRILSLSLYLPFLSIYIFLKMTEKNKFMTSQEKYIQRKDENSQP